MIPTSIDGTDITGATIDGQDVQEITVDGQTVFTAGPDIPDSVTDQWPMDEGSGTALGNDIGTVDASLTSATWVAASKYTGGYATDYDGVDDYWSVDSRIDVNGQQWGVAFWTDQIVPVSASRLIRTSDVQSISSEMNNGLRVEFDAGASDTLLIAALNGANNRDIQTGITAIDYSAQDVFTALRVDGNSVNILVYNSSAQQTDQTYTLSRGQTADAYLQGMAGSGNYTEGRFDTPFAWQGVQPTVSDIEDVWQATIR